MREADYNRQMSEAFGGIRADIAAVRKPLRESKPLRAPVEPFHSPLPEMRRAFAEKTDGLATAFQGEVAEGEDVARDGDLGDLAAAARGDALEVLEGGRRQWCSSGRPR